MQVRTFICLEVLGDAYTSNARCRGLAAARTAAAAAAAAPRAARDPSLEDRETDSPKPEDMWDEA